MVDTLEASTREVGGVRPIVSKFGFVERTKHGKTKHRLILDSKESGITACAGMTQRIMLPSVLDLVFDVLQVGQAGGVFHLLSGRNAALRSERRLCVGASL